MELSIPSKEVFAGIAIVLTLYGFIPYLRSIFSGSTKPHVFSWVIWGSTTFVVFLAQIQSGAGVGAWPIGISGSITLLVAALAYMRRADISITALDWSFFILAMLSLPLWYVTSDPLWTVIILTVVDILGFGPTLRKAYAMPHSESLPFYLIFTLRNLCVVLALESYSLTTVLFPAAIAVACIGLILMVVVRRRQVIPSSN